MGYFKKTILPIFLVGLWINISETIRWLFLIKAYWIEHYQNLNLILPDEPVNGITWMIWGFLYASMMFILSKKFNILQTALLSWFIAFVLMWIVVWNIGVLPTGMLWINAPLSLIEAYIAAFICKRLI
ncbi:MAG: hypothetical protein KAS35_01410 [Candidatus Marinimicrobia bacterium]|jgi:hypothetical protein|nr:hypothetical protein [Candidatus Neomarinimicrobiota bacterium]